MMLANDLKTYYDEVRRYLDCPKDEQDRLLLSVNKQVIELQVDNPNLDYDGIVEFYTSTIQSGVKISEKNTIVIDKDNVPPDIEDAKSYIENYYNQKEIP